MQKNQILITRHNTPAGGMIIGSIGDEICLCDWVIQRRRERIDRKVTTALKATYTEGSSPIVRQCIRELDEYFAGHRTAFDLPLRLCGTPFQNKVWTALQQIPYGQTLSYHALAEIIGMPRAVRAVANANAANPISILVPCHRVIGSDGSLTGYGGGMEAKRILLALEESVFFRPQPQ